MTPEEIVQKFKAEEREAYWKASDELMKTYAAYDKTVLTLASGAIGVCLLLFRDPVQVDCKYLLIIATCMFILSLFSILLSYLFGIISFKTAMKGSLIRAQLVEFDMPGKLSPLQRAVDICNVTSGASFILGVILLSVYVMSIYA